MAAIDEEFRDFVQSRAAPGVPMEKGRVSEELDFAATPVRIYFQRASENNDVYLNGQPLLTETVFDIEVGALDDDLVQPVAERIKDLCSGYRGAMGKRFAHSTYQQDQNDDYQPRLLDADAGIYGTTFQVAVTHEPLPGV
jgi:hypothetical protein